MVRDTVFYAKGYYITSIRYADSNLLVSSNYRFSVNNKWNIRMIFLSESGGIAISNCPFSCIEQKTRFNACEKY